MFIAMNRFRVKRGAEDAFEKVWLSRNHIWSACRVSSSSICSRDPKAKTIRSMPHIRCGRAKPPSRHGPGRRSSALRMRVQAMIRPDHFIWSIRNSRASRCDRP